MPVKKIIRHTTPDGVLVDSEYWFSLGKTDMAEMELAHMENPGEYLQDLIDNKDSRGMMDLWQEMLFRSVGIRDGDLIDKGEKVIRQFKGSGAYEEFFSELIAEPDAGFSFFISIMPADIQKKITEQTPEEREYTDQELLDMDESEFRKIAGPNEANWDRRFLMLGMRRKTMPSKAA
ncbi:hypothetical protein [Streptomyces phage Psst1]|nr:hypothetical protein [Streptomyces phage Psst1]WPJ30740.1 hypothetical protein [Streptomyces phage Psst2]